MDDLPIGRPHPGGPSPIGSDAASSGIGRPDPRAVNERSGVSGSRDTGPDTASGYVGQRGSRRSPATGFGSIIGFFLGLIFLFILAAGIAQYAVRGDRQQTGTAPPAPPVTQEQVPAQPSPPADGNPGGNTSRDAVTP
jgi:hypothetical protein